MNLSHSKGSIIILRIFSSLFFHSFVEDHLLVLFFFSFSFFESISSCPPHGRGTQRHYCTAIPKTLKLLLFADYLNIPAPCIPHQHHLCLPACASLQFDSPHCAAFFFFFSKENRRFLLQYLVGNSKKRGTATVFRRHKLRNPNSHRTSVFSSDRKEKKLQTRVHIFL